jgi:hypothetical protein
MHRHTVWPGLASALWLLVSAPAMAVSVDDKEALSPPTADQEVRLNRMELALHALTVTCINHPKGMGLAAAVAPGQPLSLPRMNDSATRRLTAEDGAQGWVLPKSLGQAALVLRPDGSCSVLVREMEPDPSEKTLIEIFDHLKNLRLQYLEEKTCRVGGAPTVTRTYSMIPKSAEETWGRPEVRYDSNGNAHSRTWRGFLLAISARENENQRHNVVMTTYIGHHVVGQGCAPGQKL